MAVNVDIQKRNNENNMSMLRRFRIRTKKSGLLNKARELRFYDRPPSDYQKKKSRLNRIESKKDRDRLYKLGKL